MTPVGEGATVVLNVEGKWRIGRVVTVEGPVFHVDVEGHGVDGYTRDEIYA